MVGTFHVDTLFSTVSDPSAARLETWEAWVADMQMHDALFKVTTTPEDEPVEVMINRQVRRTKGTGPMYCTNASNWLTGFYLAVICREQQRYRELCKIPVDLLREAGESDGARYNPYIYYWISAIQDFVLNRPGLGENLLQAMELSSPGSSELGSAATLDRLVFPQLNTFLHLVQRRSDEFNEALAEGLVAHGEYWTSSEERANNINGVVPMALLAFACFGYDAAEVESDFRFEVESGYLPKHLVQRSWYGEFPT
ncbi:immunity 49 family protein [Nocardiopsis sp. JB363]|uniref:immunity 49 family protein n=1 Tax=Nocardiopsis sp. JB363 TaxID=1434837 RepID=UPI000B35E32A|nr:immunity 49 family protein [Nocardiopsis sp. JB363]